MGVSINGGIPLNDPIYRNLCTIHFSVPLFLEPLYGNNLFKNGELGAPRIPTIKAPVFVGFFGWTQNQKLVGCSAEFPGCPS